MPIAYLLLGAVPLAWLVPNHYPPWLSAWSDGLAMLGLALAMLLAGRAGRLRPTWLLFVAIAVGNVAAQTLAGRIHFAADAAVITLYLSIFLAAVAVGGSLPDKADRSDTMALDTLAGFVLFSALVSVGLALAQWTDAVNLGIWQVDLPRDRRPVANIAQPNHLASVCFLGLCALALLHQNRRIGKTGLAVGAVWLLWGAAMPSSRTAWLEVGFMAVYAAWAGRRCSLAVRWPAALAAAVLLAGFAVLFPLANDALLLSAPRPLGETAHAGLRVLHWEAMRHAIQLEPLWGYGWGQVGAAQVRVADQMPYSGEWIEHSHNTVLDLLVWNGVPVGAVLALIPAAWFVRRAWACREPQAVWLIAGVGGLLIHALLEYPLEYAYFLIPLGLSIGAIDSFATAARAVAVPTGFLRAVGAVFVGLLGFLGMECLQAEQVSRQFRMETANIGTFGVLTPPPHMWALGPFENFLRFAQTEARPGLSPETLGWMRKVEERFALPPVMFRYALAQGLNGDPAGAQQTLESLCHMHPLPRCEEAREAWKEAQGKFPGLAAIAPPNLPDTSRADQLLPPTQIHAPPP